MLTGWRRARSFSACATTASGSSHTASRSALTSIPARSWNSVRVKPGTTASTRTPYGAMSTRSDSLKAVIQALAAP